MTVRETIVGAGFFFILTLSPTLWGAESSTVSMEKALKERSRGDYSGAVQSLKAAVAAAKRPNQKSLAQFMLGDCLMELKQPQKAREVFEEVISESKENDEIAEASFRIAQCHAMSGNHENMRTACDALIKKFPNTPYAELARFLNKSGRVKVQSGSEAPQSIETVKPVIASLAPEKQEVFEVASNIEKPSEKAIAEQPAPPPVKTIIRPKAENRIGTPGSIRIEPGSGRVAATDSYPKSAPPAAKAGKPPIPVIETTEPETASTISAVSGKSTIKSEPLSEVAPVAPIVSQGTQAGAPKDLLTFPDLTPERREELATEILKDQNRLGEKGLVDPDEVLFRLASQTAQFGEILESCKLYDKLLSKHPSSHRVEESYFEAIRLRAVLKAFSAALTWGEGFKKTFPRSKFLGNLKRLMDYAKTPVKTKISSAAVKASSAQKSDGVKPHVTGNQIPVPQDVSSNLLYREGKRLVKNGKYSLGLVNFKKLALSFPKAQVVWWEMALVQVQLKRFPEAEKSLQTFLELDPNNEEARSLLGFVHFQQKDYQQAAADYTQAGQTSKEGLEFFNSLTAAQRLNKSNNRSKSQP